MNTLENELGYNVQYRVIDAALPPQHRERIVIVGFRDKTDFNVGVETAPEGLSQNDFGASSEDGSESEEPYTKAEKLSWTKNTLCLTNCGAIFRHAASTSEGEWFQVRAGHSRRCRPHSVCEILQTVLKSLSAGARTDPRD